MADLIKIDPEKLEGSVGQAVKFTNSEPIVACDNLAKALKPLRGNEPIIDSAFDGLVAFQTTFNSMYDSANIVIQNFTDTCDIGEFMSKQSANKVKSRDAEFTTKKVDPSRVVV